ncbi:hypothetical protein [Paenibacillus sp. XY044]|uniref:hypothetical protein n=1 Tax=Paenibacillus sp. XY044 TaxID=2026089 RepID=UPI000B9987FB|nr:hypothetical protein [Paenibacillus sp. XY044]OZB98882.1 hypothetical protein CJP46_07050 [Paenibacillus sp. XY044]
MKNILIGTTAVFAVIMLAGCGTVDDAAQKFKQEAHETVVAAGKTVKDSVRGIEESIKSKGDSVQRTAEREVEKDSMLQIHHEAGNITLVAGPGNKITVETTIWFLNDQTHRNIAEQAETSIVERNGTMEIVTHAKDEPGRDLWDWAESRFGKSELLIEYVVNVPDKVTGYEIVNEVGSITMNNLNGSYQVENHVGGITVEGAYVVGKSKIKSEAGSVRVGILEMERGSSLQVGTDVGGVQAVLANSLSCTLKVQSELGTISGVSKGSTDINGGGPIISISTSVGAISVEESI